MKAAKFLAFVVLGLLMAVTAAQAQGVGTSGEIRGTVTDPSGAVASRATVTVTDPAKGIQRTSTTGSDGTYRFVALPPATYDVTVQLAGFQSEVKKNVVVTVGGSSVVDFGMKVSPKSETVEVTTEPPAVEVERSSQANTVTEKYIEDLPIDRRDYLTFTLLMPGVSNSTVIADNADFRVKQTPQSGLSFYGSNGRGNSITVEGGETNDDAGGVRLNVGQEAVQEFQINRSNYSAELGGASGASVNIVTKSGSNRVHGSVFGLFRNDAMDAANPFAISSALAPDPTFSNFSTSAVGHPIKNSLSRQQFGGSVGFPITKDKTFMFLSYEGLNSDAKDAVPLLANSSIFAPTNAQSAIIAGLAASAAPSVPCLTLPPPAPPGTILSLPAAACAFALSSILPVNPTLGPNPFVPPTAFQRFSAPFIVSQFENNSGLFSFPTKQHQGYARLDHKFSNSNQAFLRYSAAHLTETDPDVQALTAISRGTSELSWDSTLQGSWFHQFSANDINELRAQWNINQFNVTTNDQGGPGLDVQGYGFFGRGIFLPSFTRSRRYEFADNVTLLRGHHNLKFGVYELVRGNKTTSDTFFAGRFEFLQLPGGLVSPCMQVPALCGLASNLPTAPISTLQAWNLGLPAFFEQGFGNPTYADNRPFTASYIQDSWQVRPNLTLNLGLRYEVDSQYKPLNTYKKDFAPRVSFAWDPFKQGKTVVRGGYGIFYSPVYAQIANVVKTLGNNNNTRQIANSLVTILGNPSFPTVANSAAIYQVLFSQGKILCGTPPAGQNACISPSDLTPLGLTIANTGPLPPGTVLFFGQPDYRPPMSQQFSLGIEQQIGNGLSVSANYIHVHTTHLPWAVDRNLLPGAPVVTGTGANGLPTNGLPFQNWGAPQCFAPGEQCFADPTHTILQNNEYSSIAAAKYDGGILEVRKRFSDRVTLLGNYTYSKAIDDATDFNSDYAAFNEVALNQDRALSDFDQRHKIVFAGVFGSPWNNKVLSGFQLSPIFSYNSGHPFNLLAGADINGDGHFTNDRPPGAPRNSGLGPNYFSWDMRLTRAFKIGERGSLQLLAEGFNLTNRTNYTTVNNILGNDNLGCPLGVTSGAAFGPPFNVHGSNIGPSCSLGFTSAAAKRELQLGLRYTF